MKYKTDDLLQRAERDEKHSSVASAEKTFADEAASEKFFSLLKTKLEDVHEWNAHALLTSFELFDENGRALETQKITVGAFLRISLTGAIKYDWVRVESVDDTPLEFIIRVRPTFDPTDEDGDKSVISHFFTGESVNNFCLYRKANTVALRVIGLNEKLNSGETSGTLETVRNAAVNLGSYLGVQRGEWEKFCHHFMEDYADAKSV